MLMIEHQKRIYWWQKLIQRVSATSPISWFLARILHRVDILLLRKTQGRFSATSTLTGLAVFMVTTIGAKTGRKRSIPLVGLREGARIVLIASNFGQAHNPAWYHNLVAYPEVEIHVEGRSMSYSAREVLGDERETLWSRAVELYPGFNAYKARAKNRRIPVVSLTPKGE
jgi:deazaflavin-dependent oxidoreductase (nitroreductase family)